MQKKMIHIQIEKHTEYFTKLLSFDCHLIKNEPRNAVNSTFLGSCTLLKLYVVIYILYSLDFIFHIFSMNFPYIPRYPYFYCSFCRHFIDNWEQGI